MVSPQSSPFAGVRLDAIVGPEREAVAQRFWSRVDRRDAEDCWLCLRAWDSHGRSRFRIGGKLYWAARVSYLLTYGEIGVGLCVCHRCDNGRCVNPAHLFLATRAGNNTDKQTKGRARNRWTGRLRPVGTPSPRRERLFLSQRLEQGLDKSGVCWLWQRSVDRDGYGIIMAQAQGTRCHVKTYRLAFILAYGPIPAGMVVGHDCDVLYAAGDMTYRRCCNPAHLALKTDRQNLAERIVKGRHVCGARQWRAKLTDDDVRAMRVRSAQGEGTGALSRAFGVTTTMVRAIVGRRSWRHVD